MTSNRAARARLEWAAMRLYRHWVSLGRFSVEWRKAGHWYPLCSERQAIAFGKACAALSRISRPQSRARGRGRK